MAEQNGAGAEKQNGKKPDSQFPKWLNTLIYALVGAAGTVLFGLVLGKNPREEWLGLKATSSDDVLLAAVERIWPFEALQLALEKLWSFAGGLLTSASHLAESYLWLGVAATAVFALILRWSWPFGRAGHSDHERRASIRAWVIPLRRFRFHHEPYRRESEPPSFIGRAALCAEFLALLNNSQNSSGSYLVTGYRGAGKTSLVKKVLHDYADGRQELSLRERTDLLSPFFIRLGNRLIAALGWALLSLHRHQARLTSKWREKGRPAPKLAWNMRTWPLLAPAFLRWLGYAAIVAILLLATPEDDRWTWVLAWLGLALFTAQQFAKHRFAIFYPPHWLRWIFRPVVTIHINLGHDRLDPRKILFGLVHILRGSYRQPFRAFSAAWLIRTLGLLLLSLTLTIVLYDLFRTPNERLERYLQMLVFPQLLVMDHSTNPELAERLARAQLTRPPAVENMPWPPADAYEVTTQPIDGPPSANIDSPYRIAAFKPICRVIQASEKPEQAPREASGPSSARAGFSSSCIDPENAGRPPVLSSEPGSTRLLVPGTEARALIKTLGQDLKRPRVLCDYLPEQQHGLVQRLYCGIDVWLVDIYCHDPRPGNQSACKTRPDWNPRQPRTPPIQLEPWLYHFLNLTTHSVKWVSDQVMLGHDEPKKSTQDVDYTKAPRLYQVLFFLLITGMLRSLIGYFGRARVLRMLDTARERIVATDTVELGASGGMMGLIGRRSREYPPLDVRQTEAMILDILEANRRVPRFLPRADLIFVFDELDKINPEKAEAMQGASEHGGRSLNEVVRRRKVEVEELLSNLKNLITVAPCRFIFIAGREMMDANLADQTATNHLYSSLFDRVIYVPSLLTDPSDGNEEDISSMVEQYVCRRLLPRPIAYYLYHYRLEQAQPNALEKPLRVRRAAFKRTGRDASDHLTHADNAYRYWSLEVFAAYLTLIHKGEDAPEQAPETNPTEKPPLPVKYQELMCLLQDFVYYLTYRSAGNPKKLALQFEGFVVPLPDDFLFDRLKYHRPAAPLLPTTNFLLRLTPEQQYELQLISQVFLLFHGDLSALIRKYGDKLAVATFSILDYLLKFHSLGFNSSDLERMPDFLDINRAPALPQLVRLLLERLLAPNLRRVNNGIYEYRFLLHFQREVVYISQFSEQELAAFNFTLDESIAIKQHFRDFRDEQLRLRREVAPVLWPVSVDTLPGQRRGGGSSLPFIDVILGDLHNLDREYDEALTEYRNALDAAEPGMAMVLGETPAKSTPRDAGRADNPPFALLLLYIRTLMKLGLIHEQRRQFDHAEAAYLQARLLVNRLRERWGDIVNRFSESERQLYLFAQPYIALAFLRAKRDTSTVRALHHLDEAICDLTPRGADAPEGKATEAPTPAAILKIRLYLRRGELLLFRSNMRQAACWFAAAACEVFRRIRGSAERIDSDGESLIGPLDLLGYALSGLGDALAGRELSELNGYLKAGEPPPDALLSSLERGLAKAKEVHDRLPGGRGRLNDSLKQLFGEIDEHGAVDSARPPCKRMLLRCPRRLYDKQGSLLRIWTRQARNESDRDVLPSVRMEALENWCDSRKGSAIWVYSISALAYQVGGRPAEAALSIWKAAYMVSFGLSYWAESDRVTEGPRLRTQADFLFKNSWLGFDKKDDQDTTSPLHRCATEAFHGAYRVQRTRLQELGVAEARILRWVTPPLSQSMMVLASWWSASPGHGNLLSPDEFPVRSMGAFPVYPRILASYLKGRWYHETAFGPWDAEPSNPCGSVPKCTVQNAFRFLVDAAEDGEAYEGGLEMLNPPIGFIYFHLWRTVKEVKKTPRGAEELHALASSDQFRGERMRFFKTAFLKVKAQGALRDLLSRHGNDEGFYTYAGKQFYLTDSFSDAFVNGLWSIEHGLMPIAKMMLKRLAEPSDDGAEQSEKRPC